MKNNRTVEKRKEEKGFEEEETKEQKLGFWVEEKSRRNTKNIVEVRGLIDLSINKFVVNIMYVRVEILWCFSENNNENNMVY